MQKKTSFEDYQIKIISFFEEQEEKTTYFRWWLLVEKPPWGRGRGHIKVFNKPQNLSNNNRKPQNRNKVRSKPKTSSETREDVQVVEVFEAHIFRRETEKHQTASNSKSKNSILFLPKIENGVTKWNRNRTPQQTPKPKNRSQKWPKPQNHKSDALLHNQRACDSGNQSQRTKGACLSKELAPV